MIKEIDIADMAISGGIVSASVRVIHDDKEVSGVRTAFEVRGNPELTKASQGLIEAIKETLKTKLGIAPTFAE